MSVRHHFGSPLLPTTLREVRSDDHGITLHVDTEEHDKGLLRSIAEAVRTDEEVVEHLKEYAEIYNRLDEIERQGPRPHERAVLEDEMADALLEIDRACEWQTVGEGQTVRVNKSDTETLAAALVRVVAEQIQAEEPGVVRDLHEARTGGAA